MNKTAQKLLIGGLVLGLFTITNLAWADSNKVVAAIDGAKGRSDAFREAAATDQAWDATVVAAKAIALTGYDLLTHPEKVKTLQEEFKNQQTKEGK